MARFSAIAKGHNARRGVALPLLDGTVAECDVVPLIGALIAEAEAGAHAYAKAHGIADPKPGQPLYELGLRVHTLLRACLDKDEPEKKIRFFDSIEQILDPETGLDQDRIAYLFEAQQAWEATCTMRPRTLDAREFIEQVVAHAEAEEPIEELPFERWPRVLQRSFVSTISRALWNSHPLRSVSGPGAPAEPMKSSASQQSFERSSETPETINP